MRDWYRIFPEEVTRLQNVAQGYNDLIVECGENILDNQKNIAVKITNMKQRPTTTPTISPQDLVLVYLPKKKIECTAKSKNPSDKCLDIHTNHRTETG